eukprot:6467014-Amphidinium_carterae.2
MLYGHLCCSGVMPPWSSGYLHIGRKFLCLPIANLKIEICIFGRKTNVLFPTGGTNVHLGNSRKTGQA